MVRRPHEQLAASMFMVGDFERCAVPRAGGGGKRYFDSEYDGVPSSPDVLKLPSLLADSETTPWNLTPSQVGLGCDAA